MIGLPLVLIAFLFLRDSVSHVDRAPESSRQNYLQQSAADSCNQSTAERNALITRAENENRTVRRVEFLGITHTPDRIVRSRMTAFVNEGDVFSGKKLTKSLRNMSKLKRNIHPVAMKDVVLELNEPNMVDMLICFRERRR